MKTTTIVLLGLLVIVQFSLLGTMIHGKENVLRHGQAFRFKTRPIDPADPFQGRFVALGFEHNFIALPKGQHEGLHYKDPIYVSVETSDDGFARLTGWSRTRPTSGSYIKTRYIGPHNDWNAATHTSTNNGMNVELPFDRFYMDEAKAPRAETAVREATRSTNCWTVVRILKGKAVIDDVYVCGQSLRLVAAKGIGLK